MTAAETPFAFGKNWSRFLSTLDDSRIEASGQSLLALLHSESLEGKRFLDAGSGSGLFSLTAHQLGADVTSFDVDDHSVGCTQELKRRFAEESDRWMVRQGSLLDESFMTSLGQFDVVYCWGVAHHTGDMYRAIHHLLPRVGSQGSIVLAIYNDQQYVSKLWSGIKLIYQRLPSFLKPLYVALVGAAEWFQRGLITLLACLLRLFTLRNPIVPIQNWVGEVRTRGMHGWYDLVDWVGGWPFEVARPEEIFRTLRDQGFVLLEMTTSGGHGCNEFVFRRETQKRET